jgi:myosin-7
MCCLSNGIACSPGVLVGVRCVRTHTLTCTGPAHKVDCREATKIICRARFGKEGDFQLGKTKLFLKDVQALQLEQWRDAALYAHAVAIQRAVRGWCARRRYERWRQAAITIQRVYRGYAQRARYRQIRLGFARLQAVIRARQLVAHYTRLRYIVVAFQVRTCEYADATHASRHDVAAR